VKNKMTSLFSGSIAPLGETASAFDIVSPEMLAELAPQLLDDRRVQLLAKVTAYGALGGSGDELDAVPFYYPVTVCRGCVALSLGACPLPAGTPVINGGSPCNVFQDGFSTCCSVTAPNGTTQLICPAVVSETL
jgi:hypothetical protein